MGGANPSNATRAGEKSPDTVDHPRIMMAARQTGDEGGPRWFYFSPTVDFFSNRRPGGKSGADPIHRQREWRAVRR
jgi:hypothetical protein